MTGAAARFAFTAVACSQPGALAPLADAGCFKSEFTERTKKRPRQVIWLSPRAQIHPHVSADREPQMLAALDWITWTITPSDEPAVDDRLGLILDSPPPAPHEHESDTRRGNHDDHHDGDQR